MSTPQRESIVTVEENLIVKEIAHIRNILNDAIVGTEKMCVDLRHVSDCDSAGVQLLVSLRKTAAANRIDIHLSNTPEVVSDICSRYGFDIVSLFNTIQGGPSCQNE